MDSRIQVGVSFQQRHGSKWRRYHVRAIVDGDQAVLRYWHYGKQRWVYLVESDVHFKVFLDGGMIRDIARPSV